ncbi:outer membrane protein [Flexithrix dorotheae]|uniref:outer membrane protein n=1 Tax=Flexithrix dorotheae TaxID=70993 RepID=UPI0003751B38|nr:outer membrane beta-barrel protein [Flexithrix dorotheae]
MINAASAQKRIELTPTYGYQFGGKANYVEGSIKLQDAANYGGILSVEADYGVLAELSYSYMETRGNFIPYRGNIDPRQFDLNVQYFQLGAVKELMEDDFRPFGLFSLGATYFNPKNNDIEDVWRFSITLGGGIKYFISEKIGIRAQGRLLLPMYFNGVGGYCGIGTGGSGCGLGVSTAVPLVQGDFSGGLIFRLGE